jgi:hypothetical protein
VSLAGRQENRSVYPLALQYGEKPPEVLRRSSLNSILNGNRREVSVSRGKPNWQPISKLPLIGPMIDGLLEETEKQCQNLQSIRATPQLLDNYTIGGILEVYSEQAGDLWLFEEQLFRWKSLDLTPAQRHEIERLANQLAIIRERIATILSLAQEWKQGLIETVLAKGALERSLEFPLGKQKPN